MLELPGQQINGDLVQTCVSVMTDMQNPAV